MTWITGGICFNGCICIGDTQVTIIHRGKPQHFNCLQKVHKVYDNAIIGFSGDVRLGLIIIDRLKKDLESCLRPENHYFDLDGETDKFENWLKSIYSDNLKATSNQVEFVLYWTAQDDGESEWRFYGCKFKSPDFKRTGHGLLQSPLESGSGSISEGSKEANRLITGSIFDLNKDLAKKFKFSNNSEDTRYIYTCQKLIQWVIEIYKNAGTVGVSKSTFGFTISRNLPKIPDGCEDHFDILRDLGLWKDNVDGNDRPYSEFDWVKFIEMLTDARDGRSTHDILDKVKLLANTLNKHDFLPLASMPTTTEFATIDNSEATHIPLLSTYNDIKTYFKGKGIRVASASATA